MTLLRLSEPLIYEKRRLFITGGTGFIGRSLLDYLTEVASVGKSDFKVTVLSRTPNEFLEKFQQYSGLSWLSFVEGSLNDLPDLREQYTDVVHAAADTHLSTENSMAWLEQLTEGTRHILDLATSIGAQRFLFISSGAVYGHMDNGNNSLFENSRMAPLTTDTSSIYAHGKRMAETLCSLYNDNYDINCVIGRCFSVLSPHIPLDGPYAAGNFIRDAIFNDVITITGDGLSVRTYIDGRDMAHWMFSLLAHGTPGEAYNVGSDFPVTLQKLAECIAQKQVPKKLIMVKNHDTGTQKTVYLPSIYKSSCLGLRIETQLDQSIERTIHAIKNSCST